MKSYRLQLILWVGLLLTMWALFAPAFTSNAGLLLFTPTAWFYLPLIANNAAPVTPGSTVTPTATASSTPTRTSTRTPTRTPTPICPASPSCTAMPSDTPTPTLTLTTTQTPTETPTPTNTPDCLGDEPVDSALSSFMAMSSTIRADGVETADLVVTLLSTCGVLMPSQPVTITSSRVGGVDVISPVTGLTNASGQFLSTLRSALSSPVDDTTGVFTPTTLTAQAGAGPFFATLGDQPTVQFTCANGLPAGFATANDIQYFLINETPEDRSLDRVTLTWPSGATLTTIDVYPPTFTVWSGAISMSPAVVSSGWLGTPANRNIPASGGSLFLRLVFNVDLSTLAGSPNNPFEIQTQWKDEATGRVCTSDFITILR